jgi:putative polyhydroxyalkanoate system protein
MPKFSIEHAHTLAPAEVKQRLQTLSERLAQKYGIDSTWHTETEASFKRTGATGTIRVHPDKVAIAVDLSFALTPLRGQIEERIKTELSRALS